MRRGDSAPSNWSRDGLLYVPRQVMSDQLTYLGVRVTYEDAFKRTIDEGELLSRVRGLSRSSAIIGLARLMLRMSVGWFHDLRLRHRVIGEIFPRVTAAMIKEMLRSGRRAAALDPHSAMILAKLVLLHSPERGYSEASLANALSELPALILAAGDVRDARIQEAREELDESGDAEALRTHVLRGMAFVDSPRYWKEVARYHRMFVTLPCEGRARRLTDWVDVASVFGHVTGFDLQEYLAAGLLLVSFFAPTRDGIDPLRACFRVRRWLGGLESIGARDLMSRLVRELSRPASRMSSAFRRRQDLSLYFDFLPLERTPLVRLRGGLVCCVWPQWLEEAVSAGVYWRLHGGLGRGDKGKFTRFVGKLFEFYIADLLRSCLPADSVFPASAPKKSKSADLVVFQGDMAFFIEVATSHLQKFGSEIEGRPSAIDRDLENLAHEARQALACARAFVNGQSRYGTHVGRGTRHCLPVVVTLHHAPVDPFTLRRLRGLAGQGEKRDARIHQPVFMGAGELEDLCSALSTGGSMRYIVAEWLSDERQREWWLGNFLAFRGLGRSLAPILQKELDTLHQRANVTFGDRG